MTWMNWFESRHDNDEESHIQQGSFGHSLETQFLKETKTSWSRFLDGAQRPWPSNPIQLWCWSVFSLPISFPKSLKVSWISIITLSIKAERCYAECDLCWLSLTRSVICKPLMLSVIMLHYDANPISIENFLTAEIGQVTNVRGLKFDQKPKWVIEIRWLNQP